MTYEQTLEYLYGQMPEYQRIGHMAYKPGLDNSHRLDKLFDHPHRKYKTIHVGGTNGKGSTSHLLAAILQQSGYKTGLYTSPHLVDFRERIRVNGKMIPKKYVMDFVQKYKDEFEPVMPSFFELTMEMAFLYFAEQEVDVAIIEVGLGGRLDSTNIINPDLSVVTNIGLDHTQYLGNTLAEVAAEKAGIFKAGTPALIGEAGNEDVKHVFMDRAAAVGAPLVFSEESVNGFRASRQNAEWVFQADGFPRIVGALGGFAQEKNARTVLAAVIELRQLGYTIPDKAVVSAFVQVVQLTGLMGRWQKLSENPKVICDTGHNAHAMPYIAEQLNKEIYDTQHIVFGMVNDKDVTSVLSMLPKDARYYFTRASVERAVDAKELSEMAAAFGLHGDYYPTVSQAVEAAKEAASASDLIFIGGSSFVVADLLAAEIQLGE